MQSSQLRQAKLISLLYYGTNDLQQTHPSPTLHYETDKEQRKFVLIVVSIPSDTNKWKELKYKVLLI